MKFFFIFVMLYISSLNAVDIKVSPTSNFKDVTFKEVKMLQERFMLRRIQIDDKNAKKIILENRYLSEEYLKHNKVPEDVMINMKLEFEKYLASQVIKDLQLKIEIDDDVTKSYYVANQKEFLEPKVLNISIYRFNDFDESIKFYNLYAKDLKEISKFKNENNISITSQEVEIIKLNKIFQNLISFEKKEPPYLLPPQFFYGHYSVIYVKSEKQEGIKSYKDVKDSINKILYRKSFDKKKNEILKTYQKVQ